MIVNPEATAAPTPPVSIWALGRPTVFVKKDTQEMEKCATSSIPAVRITEDVMNWRHVNRARLGPTPVPVRTVIMATAPYATVQLSKSWR